VSIIDNLFGPQVANIESAMSKATQRQAMLSDNVANLNTPGFKRKDVDFNILLQEEMTPGKLREQQLAEQQAQEASDQTSLRVDGNNVDLEREVMGIAETQLRYSALADVASTYFSDLKSVIKGQ
jgi:flagellar basal-body rod protein FlgB